jgi:hypothetical protein
VKRDDATPAFGDAGDATATLAAQNIRNRHPYPVLVVSLSPGPQIIGE